MVAGVIYNSISRGSRRKAISRSTRSKKLVEGAVEGVDSISNGALPGEGGGDAISLSPVLLRVSR